MDELYECENDCGFKGTYSEVEKHELTCKFKKKIKIKITKPTKCKNCKDANKDKPKVDKPKVDKPKVDKPDQVGVLTYESNPKKWMKSVSTVELKKHLDLFDKAYYEGEPLVNDKIYDMMSDYYYKKVKGDKSSKIGSEVSINRVKLPVHLGSMDKLKPGQSSLTSFLSKYTNEKVVSEKLDGNSLLIGKDANNKCIAYTRGNGKVGQDVSHIIHHIKTSKGVILNDILKKLPSNTFIRGELIISMKNWESYNHLGTAARNVVAGIIHRKTYTEKDFEIMRNVLDFLAYEIIDTSGKTTPLEMFNNIIKLGLDHASFLLIPGKECTEDKLPELLKFFKDKNENEQGYEIDGIIVANNQEYSRVTTGNPKHAKAFKMEDYNETGITTVQNIDWGLTKHGLLKPTLEVKKVQIGDVSVSRVFAYNAEYIKKNELGIGSTIEIIRSGDVIPKVKRVIHSKFDETTDFPPSSKWEWRGLDIVDINPDDKLLNVRKISHFIKTLEIDKIGPGIISKLYDAGLTTIEHYILLESAEQIMDFEAEGIKIKTATNIYENIKKSLSNVTLDVFAAALPSFKSLGTRKAKLLVENIPDFYTKSVTYLNSKIPEIELFSESSTEMVIDGLESFNHYLKIFNTKYSFKSVTKPKPSGSPNKLPLLGKKYCFTGFRITKEQKSKLENLGGEETNSVTKDTTALVVESHPYKESGKTKSAKSKKIPIITKDEFLKQIMV